MLLWDNPFEIIGSLDEGRILCIQNNEGFGGSIVGGGLKSRNSSWCWLGG